MTAIDMPNHAEILNIFDRAAWKRDALCGQLGAGFADEFYPEKGGSTKLAKTVCKKCPVVKECLTDALERGDRYGVFGGTSPQERQKLLAGRTAS